MDLIGKPGILKEINSSMIERLINKYGTLSKSKLSEITKLSIPTVNKLVDDLEKKGRICSVGMTTEGAGRKAVLYEINKDYGCLVVLYYSGEQYLCRLSDIAGNTLREEQYRFDNSSREAAMNSTVSAINTISNHAPSEVKAIGVGVPGVVAPDGRLWGAPKIEVWEGFNLEKSLSEHYDADIYIENDVKLSTVGYYLTHLGDELNNMVYIYAGKGMGSGIIMNKKLYRGSTNFSGELGYMAPLGGVPPPQDYALEGGYLESKLNPLFGNDNGNNGDMRDKGTNEALVNYFTAIAANYNAIIDPDAIIFGGEAFDAFLIKKIEHNLEYYSPKRSIPRLAYDTSDKTGVEGLVLACMGNITTVVQLVQDGGI
ncbi:MAG: ROK family transcriptional regulator [Oscillospiraceae bacterium]|nr:ROK family transcriptional regulator [Oscillospiraceae bacterium]